MSKVKKFMTEDDGRNDNSSLEFRSGELKKEEKETNPDEERVASSSYFQTDCGLQNGTKTFQSPKKRKVDKDGFVTPGTPEMKPKRHGHSIKLQSQGHNHGIADETTSTKQKRATDKEDDVGFSNICQTQGDPTRIPSDTDHNQVIANQGEETEKLNLEEFLREKARYSMEEVSKWCETFRKSEEFEENCVRQLDTMIAHAKALENRLLTEKNAMRDRLLQICRTLQSM